MIAAGFYGSSQPASEADDLAAAEERVSALIEHTVLDSAAGGNDLRFDDMLWGWFFVAQTARPMHSYLLTVFPCTRAMISSATERGTSS